METDPNQTASFRMMMEMTDRNILRSAFDMPMVDIIAWDPGTNKIVAMNQNALATTGRSLRRCLQQTVFEILPEIPQERLSRIVQKLKTRPSREVTFRLKLVDSDGQPKLGRVVLRYSDERRPTIIALVQNITRYLEARTAANNAEAILSTAIEALPDGFVLYDDKDRLVICNERYLNIYESSAAAMCKGVTFREILQYGLDRGEYAAAIGREEEWLNDRLAAHDAASITVEQKLSSGQWLRIVERKTPDGGRVGLRIDITELKNNEAKLEKYARTDHLTGLMNRRGLTDRLNVLSKEMRPNERIAVLHVDLDKFKSINDAQGHDAGDYVLKHVAKVLCRCVDAPTSVARVGGDEFIILIRSTQSTSEIVVACQEIISLLAKPLSFRDRVCNFGASIGVAFHEADGEESFSSALTGADIALNEAKQAGRGKCRVFEDEMRDGAVQLIQMAQEIRLGIIAGEFEPFFQPQVNTVTGEIIGFEALIRWRHPTRGLVPAFSFLPAAEKAGLMDALDNVVMDQSCAAAAEIASWGYKQACVSINMSMPQLRDPDILKRLIKYMDRHGITPKNLRIELLESTLLDERSDVIVQNVHRMIAHGFAVELDDFGTGHAAIATLRKFAVSRIKIDRSLVQDIDSDAELRVITGAIINLADRLGIKALAEGVETPAEQRTLQDLGCDCAQGYLHARPMPLDQLNSWMAAYLASRGDEACPQMRA